MREREIEYVRRMNGHSCMSFATIYAYTSSSIMLSTILTEQTSVSTSNFLTFTKEGSLYLKEYGRWSTVIV